MRDEIGASNPLRRATVEMTTNESLTLTGEIGKQIRKRRHGKGLSLRGLGAKTGLSASSLSQIERGTASPTLTSLTSIARALDVSLFEFFVGNAQNSLVVKNGHHLRLQLPETNVQYELVSRRGSSNIAVMRARLQAGSSVYDAPQSHPQEECLFVLKGQVEVTLGDEKVVLNPQDAIHYDGIIPHLFTAIGDDEAEYILCISPVIF
jgi:transcriptional regulator with XRE-family HTH domain